ncbi:polysaccharide biosynthesis/export family protein [Novosphingobium beihaiensis]|uniref:Polysaccharide export protein n=1 Tax=Novosphingobium beihaiensis TaxID=2930389 RepID=A0ABT0BUP9_9SPHN|nr:polysaccharide biosynthesis/export family protein [Novosphingobium beihaiensis]MCJ2188399.1 polysaccharide export protein [Novosphingobium beihaiensis]
MRKIDFGSTTLSNTQKYRGHLSNRISRLQQYLRVAASCVLSALLLSGCTTQSYPEANVAQANAEVSRGYHIGTGDKLRITVFNEPSLSGDFDVGLDGKVEMPLITPVAAADKTPDDVRQAIAAKLGAGGYVLEPRVAVAVLSYHPFYVLGEVNKPGEYTYSSDLSLLQAIAMAGGFTARANKASVVVRREGWNSGRKVTLGDPLLIIAPGDTVMVTESVF